MNIKEYKEKHPIYKDIPDETLAKKLHEKYYSDVPYDKFKKVIGLKSSRTSEGVHKGFFEDVGEGMFAGAVDLVEIYGRALRTLDPDGGYDLVETLGEKGVNFSQEVKSTYPEVFEQSIESKRNYVRMSVVEGIRSIIPSVGAGIPGGLAGAFTPGVVPGMIAGFAASGGTIFGLAEYDEFMEEAEKLGYPKEVIRSQAVKSAFVEGGLEAASDMIDLLLLKLGKPITTSFKASARQIFKKYLTTYAKTSAKVGAAEIPPEAAQAYFESKFRQDVGIPAPNPLSAAIYSIGPSAVMALLFAGLGTATRVSQAKDESRRRHAIKELEDFMKMDEKAAHTYLKATIKTYMLGLKNKQINRIANQFKALPETGTSSEEAKEVTEWGQVIYDEKQRKKYAKMLEDIAKATTPRVRGQKIEKFSEEIAREIMDSPKTPPKVIQRTDRYSHKIYKELEKKYPETYNEENYTKDINLIDEETIISEIIRDRIINRGIAAKYYQKHEDWEKLKKINEDIDEDLKIIAKNGGPNIEALIKKTLDGEDSLLQRALKLLHDERGSLFPEKPKFPSLETTSEGSKKFYEMMKKSEEATHRLLNPKKDWTIKSIWQRLRQSFVDYDAKMQDAVGLLGELGQRVIIEKDLSNGSGSRSIYDIDEFTKENYGGLSQEEHMEYDMVLRALRNLTVAGYKTGHTFADGTTSQDAIEFLQDLRRKVGSDKFNDYLLRASKYGKRAKTILLESEREGTLGSDDVNRMLKVIKDFDIEFPSLTEKGKTEIVFLPGVYLETKVLDMIDPDVPNGYYKPSKYGGRKVSVKESGFEGLDKGSEKIVHTDTQLLMANAISRTNARNSTNRASKALYTLLKENPTIEWGRTAKLRKKTLKNGQVKYFYEKTPKGMKRFSYMNKGKRVDYFLNSELAEVWASGPPVVRNAWTTLAHHLSGTSILKAMATGYNPAFAVTNIFRDIALIWAADYHEVYSKYLPIYVGQMSKDIGKVLLSAKRNGGLKKTPEYSDYIRNGGGIDFLVTQGRLGKGRFGVFNKFARMWGYLGEASEITTRLAYYGRAYDATNDMRKAAWIARSYLDFAKGGNASKTLDTFIPYLNAGIEATRGMTRSAIKSPGLFTAKMAQVGTLSIALYFLGHYMNPDAEDEMPKYDRTNYWIIPFPKSMSYLDEDGNRKYYYIKIAKDQGQRIISSIFENMAKKFIGKDFDEEEVVNSVWEFFNIFPSSLLPPTFKAVLGYAANYDWWRGDAIWKGSDQGPIKPGLESSKYTPNFLRKSGEAIGFSPARMDYVLKQYFVSTNPLTQFGLKSMDYLTGGLSQEDRDKVINEVILDKPFINRFLDHTEPYHRYKETLEEAGIEGRSKRFSLNKEFDDLSYEVLAGRKTMDDLKNFIRKQPRVEHKRLINRFKEDKQMFRLPNSRKWYQLRSIDPPEARAVAYHSIWISLTPKERTEMDTNLMKIPNMRSKRFMKELRNLRRGFEKDLHNYTK